LSQRGAARTGHSQRNQRVFGVSQAGDYYLGQRGGRNYSPFSLRLLPIRDTLSRQEEAVMTLKFNHLHIKTKDPEKTVQFYVDTFGAKIVNKSPRGGYRVDLLGLSLNVTPFLEDQKREQLYGMEHLAIDTDELDALVAKLEAQGIHILEKT